MPFVNIYLRAGKAAAYLRSVSDAVHQAMVDTIDCPPDVQFHTVHELAPQQLIAHPSYRDVQRSEDVVMLHMILRAGRSAAQKQALYARVTELLAQRCQLRSDDIVAVITENQAEDWYFGKSSLG